MSNVYQLLSPFLARVNFSKGFEHWHWCPACKEIHRFAVEQPFPSGAKWTFDGDVNAPTFTPSMSIKWGQGEDPPDVCHYNITAGMIKFHADCTHDLKGQTVPLPPIPQDRLERWGI